jgi:dTDP-4-dehydrorhamnose 3,5-epimerase
VEAACTIAELPCSTYCGTMTFAPMGIAGLLEITPRRLSDERGYFAELYRVDAFAREAGDVAFVQENESLSERAGTLRGLHFQSEPHAQGKLVRCTAGALFDVAVDLRPGSPTFGQWAGVELSAANGRQLWIPAGFAHGFCTLEPRTVITYKVTAYYSAAHDKGIAWDDPDIAVAWPDIADPATLSPKDRVQPRLAQLSGDLIGGGQPCA